MEAVRVAVELGSKRVFAWAIDWPGWCRSGRDEATALDALVAYGPRYAHVLKATEIGFQPPADVSVFRVIERLEGNATTDFGSPGIMAAVEKEPVDPLELARLLALLLAIWQAFDNAVHQARGKTLKKGPRGGGRDLEKIYQHVLDANRAYLRRLAWKQTREKHEDLGEEFKQARLETACALEVAVKEGLPEQGPRGGAIWRPRYFVRRVAWHLLDHAWEIEDRIR